MLTTEGKRLARRSSSNKLNFTCITIIMHSAHIGLVYLPISDGRIPVLNVVIQIVAGILVPFVKSRIIEPEQLKSESEIAGLAEEFNRVHHKPFPILSIVTTMPSEASSLIPLFVQSPRYHQAHSQVLCRCGAVHP